MIDVADDRALAALTLEHNELDRTAEDAAAQNARRLAARRKEKHVVDERAEAAQDEVSRATLRCVAKARVADCQRAIDARTTAAIAESQARDANRVGTARQGRNRARATRRLEARQEGTDDGPPPSAPSPTGDVSVDDVLAILVAHDAEKFADERT